MVDQFFDIKWNPAEQVVEYKLKDATLIKLLETDTATDGTLSRLIVTMLSALESTKRGHPCTCIHHLPKKMFQVHAIPSFLGHSELKSR